MNICPISGQPCSKKKTYHITDIHDNKVVKSYDVCEDCVQQYLDKLPSHAKVSPPEEIIEQSVQVSSPPELAKGIMEFVQKMFQAVESHSPLDHPKPTSLPLPQEKKCPKCGSTAMEVYKTGRFGCEECYRTFNVENLLMEIHGATQHVGKVPKKWKEKKEREERAKRVEKPIIDGFEETMQGKMAAWIIAENYEMAAKAKQGVADVKALNEAAVMLGEKLKQAIDRSDIEEAAAIQKQMDETLMRSFSLQEKLLQF